MSGCVTNAVHGDWIPAVHAGMTAWAFSVAYKICVDRYFLLFTGSVTETLFSPAFEKFYSVYRALLGLADSRVDNHKKKPHRKIRCGLKGLSKALVIGAWFNEEPEQR